MKGHHLKLHQGSFRLDIRKNLFMQRVIRHWNGRPRELSLSLGETLDVAFTAVVWLTGWCLLTGWTSQVGLHGLGACPAPPVRGSVSAASRAWCGRGRRSRDCISQRPPRRAGAVRNRRQRVRRRGGSRPRAGQPRCRRARLGPPAGGFH